MPMRQFEDVPAVRQRVPVQAAICGPSQSGKTRSALRIAKGIQRIAGGEIFGVDTESRRMLHHADAFTNPDGSPGYRWIDFKPPHGPLDYMAVIEHCVAKGATTIIIDTGSLEHEGAGGVLEMHAAETKRLAAAWKTSEDVAKMSAWNKPKSERRQLINRVLQLDANIIWCFRAKNKMLIEKGEKPEAGGFMPICGPELLYEMTVRIFLPPGARGFPQWEPKPDAVFEREWIAVPEQYAELQRAYAKRQLDEDFGEALAKWAAGGAITRAGELRAMIRAVSEVEDLEKLVPLFEEAKSKRTVTPPEFKELRELYAARRGEIIAAAGREPGVD